jgi:hypothetical protein
VKPTFLDGIYDDEACEQKAKMTTSRRPKEDYWVRREARGCARPEEIHAKGSLDVSPTVISSIARYALPRWTFPY